jgi:hypothetical protein
MQCKQLSLDVATGYSQFRLAAQITERIRVWAEKKSQYNEHNMIEYIITYY